MFWTELEEMERLFDPLRELDRMSRSLGHWIAPRGVEYPLVNVWEGADGAVVEAELPGVGPSDVEISVKGNSLSLKGRRKAEELREGEFFHRRERWGGEFQRTLELPFEIDADKVMAKYLRGVLTITVPRAESEKPRKIAITTE